MWVRALYDVVLQRVPDSGGLDFWVQALGSGTPKDQIAGVFLTGPERASHRVTADYQNYLGRQPDPGGLAFWSGLIGRGQGEEEVVLNLLASDEYFLRSGGTNEDFLNSVYLDTLNRQADQTGLSVWLPALQSQSRIAVCRNIVQSPEPIGLALAGFYDEFLRRMPDETGLAYWTSQIQVGMVHERVQAQLLASEEYSDNLESPPPTAEPSISIVNPAAPNEGVPAILSPGLQYEISGTAFDPQASPTIDLVLVQNNITTSLGTALVDTTSGAFTFTFSMPVSQSGEASIEARSGDSKLAATETTILHDAETTAAAFTQVFDSNPDPVNLSYWETRTDALNSDLIEAMQTAKADYDASALHMDFYLVTDTGQRIASPASVREDEHLLARFVNAQPGVEASVSLAFEGEIRQSATGTVGDDGIVEIPIQVPSRLLPEYFDQIAQGSIDIVMVQGDKATSRTLTLQEGPRLLLKSAEVTEDQYMYFAVRNVTADEPVKITVRLDRGNGDVQENTWTIGKTDGSNKLDPSNARWKAPTWLKGGAQSDGIEIDINVGKDHRGYRATLLKGQSREDIIAQLIRSNGAGSIEAELKVLLSDDERALMNQMLGDGWENNASAVADGLRKYIVEGGGFGGTKLRDLLPLGATQKLVNVTQSVKDFTADQLEKLKWLINTFTTAHDKEHQDSIESSKLAPSDAFSLFRMKEFSDPHFRYQTPVKNKNGDTVIVEHQGADYGVPNGDDWKAGVKLLSPVSGKVYYLGTGSGDQNKQNSDYGTMLVAVQFTLPKSGSFLNELGNQVQLDAGQELLMFFGHLRPSEKSSDGKTEGQRFNDGLKQLTYFEHGQVVAGKTVLGYLEDQGKNGDSTDPHVHVGVYIIPPSGTAQRKAYDAASGSARFNFMTGFSLPQSADQVHYLMPEDVLGVLR